MSRPIFKLDDLYGEWSSVADAPISPLLPIDEFRKHYAAEYGVDSLTYKGLEERLRRTDAHGTSYRNPMTADELIECNRAGDDEKHLSREELIAHYTVSE